MARPALPSPPASWSGWRGMSWGAFLAFAARPARDALILVGLGRAAWYYVVQGVHPWEWPGIDARAYWGVDLAHPYTGSELGIVSTYLYSPAFAQFLAPASLLPFPVFAALWTTLLAAVALWLIRPRPWAALILFLPVTYELLVGNVHFLIAAAVVVGLRSPAAWALPILTKVTPGLGLLWFAVRREWRSLGLALGVTGAIVAVSLVLAPAAWMEWIALLTRSQDAATLLPVRIVAAVIIMAFGAATDRRWLVPVAVWLALPVVYVSSWVILLAAVRLKTSDAAPSPEGGSTSSAPRR